MKKKIFSKKKFKTRYIYFLIILILILFLYLLFFIVNNNKEYFNITESKKEYFIIPKDREGEKVSYTDKKSINNTSNDLKNSILPKSDINYTIQIFSNVDIESINKYFLKLIENKSLLININELHIFSIESEIGIDYFITYKNFNLKSEAHDFCQKLNFINKCIIINPNFQ